ncbi:filamentous hemagglutinin N-terminal domain-containing protein [Pannus brasiliensis CCIBt3594]|uniref:Filamentous hemagglutinin N-terminal domain-containing protein n=1 Tax=Pannus brasiliensis CCIBt3594 TaxID=1427578 RepID=A0AAW9QKW7_9CHRO
MSSIARILFGLNIAIGSLTPAIAQVIPDATLKNESSIVRPDRDIRGIPSVLIEGGARRGANLFHSFQEFNINEGKGVYFANPSGVTNILNRVTGGNPSRIFGRLGVSGNANLFFLNPNGILFGPKASLDLNGSFLATTASSLRLADGTIFSARDPDTTPVLTVSVPIGLGFTNTTGAIRVEGTGHNIISPGDTRRPNIPLGGQFPPGLSVAPDRTLALIGGTIELDGGIVNAPSGRIEIGSVGSGLVSIASTTPENFRIEYGKINDFRDITLARQSFLNASGAGGGNISVFGRNIGVTDASLLFIENRGPLPSGTIEVNASNNLTITGTTASTPLFAGFVRPTRGIVSQALDSGKGADVNIRAEKLVVEDSGRIYLSTFGSGAGGDLKIVTADSVQILGISPADPTFPLSGIVATATAGSGKAGSVELSARDLVVREGGLLNSSVFGRGPGGDITIHASDSIEVSGFNPNSLIPSLISSISQGSGQGGNLTITTTRLSVLDGGRVDTSTLASGNAGNLRITAGESVRVSGRVPGSITPSLIVSSANEIDPVIRAGLRLTESPTGTSGNVWLDTRRLIVSDGGSLSVRNDGTGDAGTLQISARSIELNNSGSITASTRSGNGGDLALSADRIQLRRGSDITATAGGAGNGGNISLRTNTLILLENSDILADAFAGRGGNIRILARGVFSSPDSAISASSRLGIDGTVAIATPETDIGTAPAITEAVFVPAQEALAGSCLLDGGRRGGTFTFTGTGGVPISPGTAIDERDALSAPRVDASPSSSRPPVPSDRTGLIVSVPPWRSGDPIVPAGKLIRTADGRTLLVAGVTSQNGALLDLPLCKPEKPGNER